MAAVRPRHFFQMAQNCKDSQIAARLRIIAPDYSECAGQVGDKSPNGSGQPSARQEGLQVTQRSPLVSPALEWQGDSGRGLFDSPAATAESPPKHWGDDALGIDR
jgi:hypothetical protein